MATGDSWQRLIQLLTPIHRQAAATARRLSRTSVDGDDLFQEAVLRAFDKLPSLRDESRFRPWFYAVLLTVHRNRARRSFWRRFSSLQSGRGVPEIDPTGEDGAEWEQRRQAAERVARTLATLPPVQREAVVMFEIEGFSIEEIAAMQKASVSGVKSRLSRGRERLRLQYERLGFAAPRRGAHRDEAIFDPVAHRGAACPPATLEVTAGGGRCGPIQEGEAS